MGEKSEKRKIEWLTVYMIVIASMIVIFLIGFFVVWPILSFESCPYGGPTIEKAAKGRDLVGKLSLAKIEDAKVYPDTEGCFVSIKTESNAVVEVLIEGEEGYFYVLLNFRKIKFVNDVSGKENRYIEIKYKDSRGHLGKVSDADFVQDQSERIFVHCDSENDIVKNRIYCGKSLRRPAFLFMFLLPLLNLVDKGFQSCIKK